MATKITRPLKVKAPAPIVITMNGTPVSFDDAGLKFLDYKEQEKAIKEFNGEFRDAVIATGNNVIHGKAVTATLADRNSSRQDMELLTPSERDEFERLKAKCTVVSPTRVLTVTRN